MRRKRLLVGVMIAIAFLCVVSVPMASAAGLLDNVWFKMRVSVKAYGLDPTTGDTQPLNFSFPAYMHFALVDPVDNDYIVQLWTETDAGWTMTHNSIYMARFDKIISDCFLKFIGRAEDVIYTYHTSYISIKTKEGVFQKATYKGTGEVPFGKVAGGTLECFGWFTISGNSVAPDKLPFTAP